MKFHEFIQTDAIRVEIAANSKQETLRELVGSMIEAGCLKPGHSESVLTALLRREELGSTGIGRGVAVPHARHPAVERLVGTVATSREGIDFDSVDGEKAFLFFLLISPPDRPSDNLRALESISRQLNDDSFCRDLKVAPSPRDIQTLLAEADNKQFV